MLMQSLKMAWKSISSNKMRSFLTMLGIVIGVASLVTLVSIVNGATGSVTDSISSLGTSLFTVTISDDKEKPLDVDEILEMCKEEEFAETAPISQTAAYVRNGTDSESVNLYGTSAGYQEIHGLELSDGRFLKKADNTSHTYVAVINAYMAQTLFSRSSNAIGQQISLNGIQFQVVGVLEEEETTTIGNQSERMEAYIPFTTMMRFSDSVREVTTFYVKSSSEKEMETAQLKLTALMMQRFDYDEDAFTITNQSEMMEAMEEVTNTLSLMLGGIAGISLIVGGIGIMNIMLVSVTERTREIGIRKAVGADYQSIMLQFLIEAVVISLIGCLIGVILSRVILFVADLVVTDISLSLSWGVVLLATGFSILIGVIFGIYPADKAAKMKPIDALRHS